MNDAEAEFQRIYVELQPKVFRYLSRFVGKSEAEDLTQETFVKAHQALRGFRGEAQLSTWIYRIATNAAFDRMRQPSFQRAEQVAMLDEIEEAKISEEQKPSIEKKSIQDEMNDCIRGYIEKLPEDYRAVLILSEYEGVKNAEIAEILGISLETVKIRLHRAKAKLKKTLEANCEINWLDETPCSVKTNEQALRATNNDEGVSFSGLIRLRVGKETSKMKLDKQIEELIAVGASITANCQPCLQYHVQKALENGADEREIADAIEIGRMVRKGASSKMDKFAANLETQPLVAEGVRDEDCSCN